MRAVTKLRMRRQASGLTQQQVADKIGISLPLYAAIERGELIPSVRVAQLLERALGEPMDQLLRSVRAERLPI